jgi:hypothetical protein
LYLLQTQFQQKAFSQEYLEICFLQKPWTSSSVVLYKTQKTLWCLSLSSLASKPTNIKHSPAKGKKGQIEEESLKLH